MKKAELEEIIAILKKHLLLVTINDKPFITTSTKRLTDEENKKLREVF